MNFYPGHVDSAVIHKNKEENAKTDYFYLKTSYEFDILVYKEVDSKILYRGKMTLFVFVFDFYCP